MATSPSAMRIAFPEFASTTDYPDSLLAFWLGFCARMIDPEVVQDATEDATYLAAAHNVVLARRAAITAAAGGTPGSITSPLSAKSVDNTSASYDTGAVTIENAGHWNGTQYGLQLYQIIRVYGAGVVQL